MLLVKVAEYLYKEELATAPIPPGQAVESFLKRSEEHTSELQSP
jgi:hypothetical protein